MKNISLVLEDAYLLKESVIVEIEDLASGSIFASGSSHLDFAT